MLILSQIIQTDLEQSVLDEFTTVAESYVEDVIGNDLSDDRKHVLKLWLAAHLIASTDNKEIAKSETVGDVKVERIGTYSNGLDRTKYGQMVIILDTTGKFKALQQSKAINQISIKKL